MPGGGYACQFCDGERAVTILVTWLTNGASVQVCDEDFAPAMINVLAVDLGVDPTRFYDGIQRLLKREADYQAKHPDGGEGQGDGGGGGDGGDGQGGEDGRQAAELAEHGGAE